MTPLVCSLTVAALTFLLTNMYCQTTLAQDWLETKLSSTGEESGAFFGYAVSMDNGMLAVGAIYDHFGLLDDAGSVSIFRLTDGAWSLEQKVRANDADEYDWFGYAVALHDGQLAVGALLEDQGGARAGAIYMYSREGVSWTQQQKLLSSDIAAGDEFGQRLALQGNTLIVGAPGDTSKTGSVYVYTFSAGSGWTEDAKLTSADGSAFDFFGGAVAISETRLVVGALGDDDQGDSSGSVYIFTRQGGEWSQQEKLTPSDGLADDWFGASVAIEGDTVCVASKNNVQGDSVGAVYVWEEQGSSWTVQVKLVANDFATGSFFGESLELRDGLIIVGAERHAERTGAVYLFESVSGMYTEQAKLVASDGTARALFGTDVAYDDGVVIVGARGDNFLNGSTYAFERPVIDPPLGPIIRLFCLVFFFLCRD